jgi:hypothetical protein
MSSSMLFIPEDINNNINYMKNVIDLYTPNCAHESDNYNYYIEPYEIFSGPYDSYNFPYKLEKVTDNDESFSHPYNPFKST